MELTSRPGTFFLVCFNSVFPRIGRYRPGMDGLVNCHFRHVEAGRQISFVSCAALSSCYTLVRNTCPCVEKGT